MVVDASEVVGIVTRHDVLKVVLRADAQIQAAVDRLLADERTAQVVASVEWGIVGLEGRVRSRRDVEALANRVGGIDGVIGVDPDLAWEIDDVIPPVTPMV